MLKLFARESCESVTWSLALMLSKRLLCSRLYTVPPDLGPRSREDWFGYSHTGPIFFFPTRRRVWRCTVPGQPVVSLAHPECVVTAFADRATRRVLDWPRRQRGDRSRWRLAASFRAIRRSPGFPRRCGILLPRG